jgi:cytochrome c peroxidase
MRVHLLSTVAMLAVAVTGALIRPVAAASDDKTNPNQLKTATPIKPGENPNPIRLVRRPIEPLSATAELGREIFFDPRLSSSGKMSCASCHSPDYAYGPPNDGPAMLGGPALTLQGARAVPSLTYLERQPEFGIDQDLENVNLAEETATRTSRSAANIVPQGGLFWDGRSDTLQNQVSGPLFDPREMDGGSIEIIAEKLLHAPYVEKFARLFSEKVFKDASGRGRQGLLVAEAMVAVGRYQIEEPSFHPYTSKYDYWLEGKARLSESEMRGFRLFNDPDKGNCGRCHISQPARDGVPSLFTNFQYEATGGPRNLALADTKDPNYFDLGICGPTRQDMAGQTQFCGMFKTPSLRNTAMRRVFFHNGVFHTLKQVMDFYNFRDTSPEQVYPLAAGGKAQKFNDIPIQYHANVDVSVPPLNRHLGQAPVMSAQEEADIIEFLKTLNDGYKPLK